MSIHPTAIIDDGAEIGEGTRGFLFGEGLSACLLFPGYRTEILASLKQAAEKAGKIDPKAMADVIHSGMVFKTVLGDLSYDKKGDRVDVDYVMYTWKKVGDKITYVQE